MEEERLTDEIVGRVNALKRKVEKEEKLRAEADEAFASAYAKLREREQFIENNTFVSNALAEKLLGPGNVASSGNGSDLRDKNGTSPPEYLWTRSPPMTPHATRPFLKIWIRIWNQKIFDT